MRFPAYTPVAACSLLFAATLFAQMPARAHSPGSVAISPDGKTLAWTLRQSEGSTLHITEVANPDPAKEKLVTPSGATNCSNGSPIWSPDSETLAFTSTCTSKDEKPGQEEIFLWSKATGDVKQLTHVVGNIEQPAWSPDGKSIAFLFVENATRSAGALDAMKPWDGVIGEDGVEIQRVYSIDLATGIGGFVTPADLHVYEFSLSPKPNTYDMAFIAAPPPGENNWWVAKLYTTDDFNVLVCKPCAAASADCKSSCTQKVVQPKVVLDPVTVAGALHGLQIAVPRYSPDGKRIALIGGLMSDQGSTGGDIWVVDAEGKSPPVDVTPGIDGTPTYEVWTRNNFLGFVEDRRGHNLLVDWDVNKKAMLDNGAVDLGLVSVGGGAIKNAIAYSPAAGDTLAYTKSGIGVQPEVWVMNSRGGEKQITHLNDGIKPSGLRVESIEWKNDGFDVQGWLTYPKHYDAKKKYPMIVEVHGGPSASAGPRGGAQWAAQGYFDFQPNPRGSFGQGEKFVQANVKDFGYGDLRDILAGIDYIEKMVPVDDHRLGMTGWSYGGFMSMFAETQTNRFAAIVAGAGISDWKSYYGENSIDQWMIPFFGASVYDDPAVYAKSSAIEFIKNAKTPMLIIVGDRDGECPAPQSFEMWHALKAEGVKTQLVVYPNEGHGFRDPAHIKDRAERTAKWFAEYLKAGSRE
jgi:dipeptidyl aminopeptidase/acylaminoacyl peptidase